MQPLDRQKIEGWLRGQLARRPEREAGVRNKLAMLARPAAASLESVSEAAPRADTAVLLEAIIKEERPVLNIADDRITTKGAFIDAGGKWLVDALDKARKRIEPLIPLVGRIDVSNSFRFNYVGTGWLIAPDIVITNRHVAQLIAHQDGRRFRFALNHNGDPFDVAVNYRRELGNRNDTSRAFKVAEVIFIETDEKKADLAFLRVARQPDGTRPTHIELAEGDAAAGEDVCVIGYPARSPSAPDPEQMDRMFKSTYDVKRLSPGEMMGRNGEAATHDCTTLGGNSGSAVIALKTGKAVALHFAGAFALENYAVPVSVVAAYKKRLEAGSLMVDVETAAVPSAAGPLFDLAQSPAAAVAQQTATVTIPVTITVTLGQQMQPSPPAAPDEAARQLRAKVRSPAIRAVRPGFLTDADGEFTDAACLQILADAREIERVRAEAPKEFAGLPVAVREASVFDLLAEAEDEAAAAIKYDDDARKGAQFSLEPINEEAELLCHVGPERSWVTLEKFLTSPQSELVSGIYEFAAPWIADKIKDAAIDRDKPLTLVMDVKTREGSDHTDEDTFDSRATFADWQRIAGDKFKRIFVPVGPGGLVRSSYHIKVTVKDRKAFWLSSGNWKASSQPAIADDDANDGRKTIAAGNREWHVIVKNKTLSLRFRSHLRQDFERSGELGGQPEAAVSDEPYVDVPVETREAVELEAAKVPPVVEAETFLGKMEIEPLLTPDRRGDVYCDAVLHLIESARDELLFQIPYINSPGAGKRLGELCDALVAKSRQIETCRIILRSDFGQSPATAQDLKFRGMNIRKCLKELSGTHTKGMVVDGARVLIGSHNWSSLGVTLNRDASLIVHDERVARYYRKVFEIDWNRARRVKLPARGIRSAVGAEPPPGFRRMRLSDVMEG
jgi:V8-like Glu-specific endopeptidase